MNEITIAICDDSATDYALLLGYLEKAKKELNRTFNIHIFSTSDDFFKNISPVFDMVFLSTAMPDRYLNETISKLQKCNSNVHLVLLSISFCPDVIKIGYDYSVQNHMLKPLNYLAILCEIKKYINAARHLADSYFWVSNRDGYFKLYLPKLRYIETENRHLAFHYENQTIQHASRISNYAETLPEDMFFRCNNSYIVNLHYISQVKPDGNRYSIHLITGETIPLSRSRHRKLLSLLSDLC